VSIRRLAVTAALTVVLVTGVMVTGAVAPAGASTLGSSPVLAADAYKWFYWIGFVLIVSLIGLLFMMAIGYYLKVLRPKWRSRHSA